MQKDGSVPVPLVIYGVPFHNVTFGEAIDWVVDRIRSGRPANIATANLDFVTRAWSDPELQRILIDADLVLADGFPIVKLAPFFGPGLKGRVTGSDLTPMLAERAATEGFSLFGLGSAEGVAEEAMRILKERHPELKVAGVYSPPYSSLLEMDHEGILARLEQARPDILFVALGAPKQEKFISMHVRNWKIPVAMGIGASLDFLAGEQKRAPLWMRRIHLEWFWRICCNPRRLFRRYIENVRFLFSASRKMISIHYMPDRPGTAPLLDEADERQLEQWNVKLERFRGLKDEADAHEFIDRMARLAVAGSLLMDVHTVPWLNSLELGALMEVNKACRRIGRRMILYAPRPKVRQLLDTCRLYDYFHAVVRLEEVERIVNKLALHGHGGTAFREETLTLELPVELTAATLPDFRKEADLLYKELQTEGMLKSVRIDAAQLDFIDSSGLGYLISLKKAAMDKGIPLSIDHVSGKARRVFEVARVDKVLLQT
ncbi:MAG: WecB/TagA/CpsF family glycosyltransferase [Pontiellaceae bacterium]|nr:WecB/TagA/CpsF family glycosyltransferase [Pontiellaceae bacterium]MBN2784304.1 WecB/TagA/CpsF family glycosyltransferase [Pontiellaceae bacterium]